ncbi:type II CRISPR RNA-guided endonuclease Cas9, partial [bacterium]|nr:type II CRISPR RNA-guided endonuclease Cas9 [bacterium]
MRILGLDGGISSIGWAIIDSRPDRREGRIVAAGAHMFNVPEEMSNSKLVPKNLSRRTNRLARRTTRRRKQRMNKLRNLLHEAGLIASKARDALAVPGKDPWIVRAEALDRRLSPIELAIALGHIAKHRGFKSVKKGERAKKNRNNPDDTGKMLAAIEDNQERQARYRTVGEMFHRDAAFRDRKRNRDGDYRRTVQRDDLVAEVRAIFAAQRRLGDRTASSKLLELEEKLIPLAFDQRPIQSSLGLVGDCAFIEHEKRCSAFAPSFERFRYLTKLANMRIVRGRTKRALTQSEFATASTLFARTKTVTYQTIRKRLDLNPSDRFDGVGADKETKDFIRAKGACQGTKTLIDRLVPAIGE